MLYRVVRVYEIEADSAAEARDQSGSGEVPMRVMVRPDEIQGDRRSLQGKYQQLLMTLDAAWDYYMDQTMPETIAEFPNLPRMDQLMLRGVKPWEISLLFDTAITAYRDLCEG